MIVICVVLRLLDEPTAAALNYGILRNLPENETQRVVFFDLGFASTQVAVVDFVKGKLSVRYKSSNPFVGGRDLDRAIYEVFRKQWLDKYKVNINDLPKQKLKLLRACQKVKKLLTGNKDALWTLDCFHDVCLLYIFGMKIQEIYTYKNSILCTLDRIMILSYILLGRKWLNLQMT